MTAFDLLRTSEAAAVIAGASCLVGWCAGLFLGLSLRWRGGSREEIRRLRMALEDSDRQVADGFATADRMARMLADQVPRQPHGPGIPGGRAA